MGSVLLGGSEFFRVAFTLLLYPEPQERKKRRDWGGGVGLLLNNWTF
jgi:hypothetical protein